jgi:hypothetical protein
MIARSQLSSQQTFICFLLGLEAFAALPLPAFNQTLAVEPNFNTPQVIIPPLQSVLEQ